MDLEQEQEIEEILAEVIDDLYLNYKENFCDWDNRTHKLGWFKEQVKAHFSVAMTRYIIDEELKNKMK